MVRLKTLLSLVLPVFLLPALGVPEVPVSAVSAVGNSAVTSVSLQVSSHSVGATHTAYTLTFRTVHPLTKGSSTIMVAAPASTTFTTADCYPDYTDIVTDDTTQEHGCGTPTVQGAAISIISPVTTAPGDVVTVLLNALTNPATPGSRTVLVSTSADPVPLRLSFQLRPPTAVGGAVLQLSSPSAGAPRVTYSLTFQSSNRFIAANDQKPTITLVAPFGTVFPQYSCGAYVFIDDTETAQGGCGPSFQLSKTGSTVVINPPTTNPGDLVTLVIRGVGNAHATGPQTLTLSTSSDPTPATLHFALVPPRAVTHPFLQLSSYAPGSTGVRWSVGFTAPDRLTSFDSPSGDSTITLVAPPGTVFPPFNGCNLPYTFVDPIDLVDHCVTDAQVSAGGSTLVIRQPTTTTPGTVMSLVIDNVTNPRSGVLQVYTSSDPTPVSLPLSHPTAAPAAVQLDSTSAATGQAAYVATFPLRSALGITSTVTLAGPTGTVFPSCAPRPGQYTDFDLTTGVSGGLTPVGCSHSSSLTLGNGITAAPGDEFAVGIYGATNATSAGKQRLQVSISTGTAAAPTYVLTRPTAVAAPVLQVTSTAAGATGVHYAVTFRATNGLFPGYSAALLSLSGATWGPGSGDNDGWDVFDDTTGLAGGGYAAYNGTPAVPNQGGNSGPAATTPSTGDGFRAAPGDVITVAGDGTGNPTAPGRHLLQFSTSGDPVTVALPLVLSKAATVRLPVLNLSSTQAGATKVSYALTFVSGGALTPNWSTITMAFPGFTWPAGSGDADGFNVVDDTTDLSGGGYAAFNGVPAVPNQPGVGTAVVTPSTGDGFYAAAGDVVTVTASPASNPATAGQRSIRLSTSANPAAALLSLVLSG